MAEMERRATDPEPPTEARETVLQEGNSRVLSHIQNKQGLFIEISSRKLFGTRTITSVLVRMPVEKMVLKMVLCLFDFVGFLFFWVSGKGCGL